jgi:hypothetical protein
MQNVYRLELAEYMGYKPVAFFVCVAATRCPGVSIESRYGVRCFAPKKSVEFLEDHLPDFR